MDWIVQSPAQFFAAVSLTGFLKFLIALTLVRIALGFRGFEMGIVTVVLSLVLAAGQVPPQSTSSYSAVFDATRSIRQAAEKPPTDKVESPAGGVQRFLTTELKSGLMVGLTILIPCIVLDLLVAHALTALGVATISSAVIAFPLRLLLFLSVDGWRLVLERLGGGMV